LSDVEILDNVRVTTNSPSGRVPTLGGLLALGKYPQKYFPQLNITLVVLPTVTGEHLRDGTRFLDSQTIDGSIPEMVAEALSAVTKNLTRRAVIAGVGREDWYEYPIEAFRELIANALVHRDYHPLARGTQVRIELYPDRLAVLSPGGLYGTVPRESLLSETVTSSRNSFLAKLLEDVEMPGTSRTICENRGSGLLATAALLREAGLEPPVILERVREFDVVIRNYALIDAEAERWLEGIDAHELSDRQRLALISLRRNETIASQQYRMLTGSDAHAATSELSGLAASGFIQKASGRKWASWRLADNLGKHPSPLKRSFTSPSTLRVQRDRREAIRNLLDAGPRSTSDLAQELGLTGEGMLYWIRRMRNDGELAPTTTGERRNNQWRLLGSGR
jgi:ATP-dependent DNA helicase RecG